MKFKNNILLALGIITLQYQTASGCDTCAVYTAAEAYGEAKSGWFLATGWQYTHFGTTQQNGHEVPNTADQYLNSQITQLVAGYGVSPWFSVQVNLAWINRSYSRPEGFLTDKDTVWGLGDASLAGKWIYTQTISPDAMLFCNTISNN